MSLYLFLVAARLNSLSVMAVAVPTFRDSLVGLPAGKLGMYSFRVTYPLSFGSMP